MQNVYAREWANGNKAHWVKCYIASAAAIDAAATVLHRQMRALTQYATDCNLIFMFSLHRFFHIVVWYEPVVVVCLLSVYARVFVCVMEYIAHTAPNGNRLCECASRVWERLCVVFRRGGGMVACSREHRLAVRMYRQQSANADVQHTMFEFHIDFSFCFCIIHKLTVALSTLQCRRSRCGR